MVPFYLVTGGSGNPLFSRLQRPSDRPLEPLYRLLDRLLPGGFTLSQEPVPHQGIPDPEVSDNFGLGDRPGIGKGDVRIRTFRQQPQCETCSLPQNERSVEPDVGPSTREPNVDGSVGRTCVPVYRLLLGIVRELKGGRIPGPVADEPGALIEIEELPDPPAKLVPVRAPGLRTD